MTLSGLHGSLRRTTLDDVFISIKTTAKFHAERLDVVLKTWFSEASNQVDGLNGYIKSIFLYLYYIYFGANLFDIITV